MNYQVYCTRGYAGITSVLLLLMLCSQSTAASQSTPSRSPQQCQVSAGPSLFDPHSTVKDYRHETERERTLHDIDRRHGNWNNKHPRWSVLEALHGYDRYRDITGAEIDRFESSYRHVPKNHKKILDSTINYSKNFEITRSLLDRNTFLCQAIVENALSYYNIARKELEDFIKDFEAQDPKVKDNKLKMLRTHTSHALKHMVRDWSIDGHAERAATFPYILEVVSRHLSGWPEERAPYKVLVPGAGLGRLAYEIALLLPGYVEVTTNEKDEVMNLAYRYITSSSAQEHTLHPFLESWSHARTRNDITHPVLVSPPPCTSPLPSMPLLFPGDFTLLLSSHKSTYQAITTLFFIDTARNLLAYLEKIHALLAPGGIWINAGPLLYGSAPYVQLTLEEVVALAERVGFVVEEREEKSVLYNFGASGLERNGYVAVFWVARKI